jgi:cell shape-determining protein MreC
MIPRIVAGTIATLALLVAQVLAQSSQDLSGSQSPRWGNAERHMQLQDSQWRQQMLQQQEREQMRWLNELGEQQRQRELREQQRQREWQPSCQPWRPAGGAGRRRR